MSVHYKDHFLNQVIFQLNFSPVMHLSKSLPEDLSNIILRQTQSEFQKAELQTFQLGGGVPVQSADKSYQWISKGNGLQFIIQNNLLQIINFEYKDHTHFHGIIDELFRYIYGAFKPSIFRMALRYINQFKLPGSTFDTDGYLNPDLTCATVGFKEEGLSRSIGSMSLVDDDKELTVNFTYGYFNSEYPNKIAKKEFLLDYDCIMMQNGFNPEKDEIKPFLIKMKEKVNYLFNKSIGEKLKELMNPIVSV